MITINTLALNETFDEISVDVTSDVAGGFYKVLFYDNTTFKQTPKAVDLSAKLTTGILNETFTITAADIGITKFVGSFYVEFFHQETCSEVGIIGGGFEIPNPGAVNCDGAKTEKIGAVANILPFKECALSKALSMDVEDCEVQDDKNAFAVQALIDAFNLAFIEGYFEDSARIMNRLNAICRTCSTCPDYDNTVLVNGGSYQTSDNSIILA